VPMVVRSMIGKSWGQGAQHSQALHAMFMHVPGLKVVAPSNAYDAKGCMISAIRDNNPVIFVEHRLLYPTQAVVPAAPFTVEFGRARVSARGNDITIVAVSNMVLECLRARELLLDAGIEAEVIDPISLTPLDTATMLESALRTRRLLVVDNGWTNCGAAAEILARVAESGATEAGVRMARMGFAATTCPPSPPLENEFYPNPAKIASTAHALVHGDGGGWAPDPERAELSYQLQFRGPF